MEKPKLHVDSNSSEVPVYNCIVYVSRTQAGFRARVANLAGLEYTGASERDVLSKIVPAFKQRLAAMSQSDSAIPWIDPPSPKENGEQERLIPVHL